MKWVNDWPVIGEDKDGDGKGEPVLIYKKPDVGKIFPSQTLQESDEFNSTTLGLQWQWQANPKPSWSFFTGTSLRLYCQKIPDSAKNYWDVPNILLQKFPAEEFTATAKCSFKFNTLNEKAGFIIMGMDYASLFVTKKEEGNFLNYSLCKTADKGSEEKRNVVTIVDSVIYFRVRMTKAATYYFDFSLNGKDFLTIDETFVARPGKWIGAKMGLFCSRTVQTNDAGYADFDSFRVEK